MEGRVCRSSSWRGSSWPEAREAHFVVTMASQSVEQPLSPRRHRQPINRQVGKNTHRGIEGKPPWSRLWLAWGSTGPGRMSSPKPWHMAESVKAREAGHDGIPSAAPGGHNAKDGEEQTLHDRTSFKSCRMRSCGSVLVLRRRANRLAGWRWA
jgi:hypothetical protein